MQNYHRAGSARSAASARTATVGCCRSGAPPATASSGPVSAICLKPTHLRNSQWRRDPPNSEHCPLWPVPRAYIQRLANLKCSSTTSRTSLYDSPTIHLAILCTARRPVSGVGLLSRSSFPRRPDYSSFRIEGVKVMPTSNPSGEIKRVTVWPQGSFLFLTRIRYPRDRRSAVALSTLSTSNSIHACGTGMSLGHE